METHTGARRPTPVWGIVGTAAALFVYGIVAFFAIIDSDANAATAVVVLPILAAFTVPIARRFASLDGDRMVFAVIMAGFGVKMLGGLARYWFAFIAAGGLADASSYADSGEILGPIFRTFNFDVDSGGAIPGTGFIRYLTGLVYAVVGSSPLAATFIYAWIGFVGLLLFYRAFRIGVPDGDHRRYLLLVLFLPSLVFWPSGLGKEAWMLFALGLCAYGTACLFQRRAGALALVLGLVAALLLRPHVGLLVYCGVVFALLVRRSPARSAAAPAFRLVALGVMLAAGVFVVSQATSFLGVQSISQEGVQTALTDTEDRTSVGGSNFNAATVNSPLDLPLATVTVLFRPFPFEARSLTSLIGAAEGFLMLGLVVFSWHRIRGVRRRLRSQPYVAFAVGFIAVFIVAFSSFSNFGLLARERSQMIPLLLVLIALPSTRKPAAVGNTTTAA